MTFHTRIKTNVLDRIIINKDSADIMEKTLNKYTVNASDSFIESVSKTETQLQLKGIFIIEELLLAGANSGMYYSLDSDYATIAELEGDIMTFKAVVGYNGEVKSLILYKEKYKKKGDHAQEVLKETVSRALRMIGDFYKYTQLVTYLKQENKITIKRASINKPKGKTKKELQREARELARRKVSVSQEKKVYDYSEAIREGEKRSYNYQLDSWNSRGYWRRKSKKDATRIWVEGSKKQPKNSEGKQIGKDFTV